MDGSISLLSFYIERTEVPFRMTQVLLLKLYYNNTVYPLDPKQSSCKRSLAVPGCFAMLGFVRPFVIVVLRHHGLP